MGRPLIATDHGGSRETVLPDETGWLVPPGDSQALAGALEVALSLTEAQRLALRDHARGWVADRFSTGRMCQSTIAVYEEILFPGDPAR
jgi:glycosyltransferase involved in cell wall biosynthesis